MIVDSSKFKKSYRTGKFRIEKVQRNHITFYELSVQMSYIDNCTCWEIVKEDHGRPMAFDSIETAKNYMHDGYTYREIVYEGEV